MFCTESWSMGRPGEVLLTATDQSLMEIQADSNLRSWSLVKFTEIYACTQQHRLVNDSRLNGTALTKTCWEGYKQINLWYKIHRTKAIKSNISLLRVVRMISAKYWTTMSNKSHRNCTNLPTEWILSSSFLRHVGQSGSATDDTAHLIGWRSRSKVSYIQWNRM